MSKNSVCFIFLIANAANQLFGFAFHSQVSTMIHQMFAGGDGVYHFKILVPSVASGAIIGKGGETIAQLQKDTTARVKMSKANDFYPGMEKDGGCI